MLAFNVIYLGQRILLGQVRMQRMKGGDEERPRQLQRDCHFLIIPRRTLSYAHNEVHFGYHAPSDVTGGASYHHNTSRRDGSDDRNVHALLMVVTSRGKGPSNSHVYSVMERHTSTWEQTFKFSVSTSASTLIHINSYH